MAALLLAGAAAPACADVLFDNIDATSLSQTWAEAYPPYYTDRRFANRITIGTKPLRIETVEMVVETFNGFEVQVCETTADSKTPYTGACADFTPDAATSGRRMFSGSRTIGWGNAAWVVMRSRSARPLSSTVFVQSHSDFTGLSWTTNDGATWNASRSITFGMRVEGTPQVVQGTCGSANGNAAIQYAPGGTNACNPGALDGMATAWNRFTWQCLGQAGGGTSPQCSAPRGYNVYTEASGGGSIESGHLVAAGQTSAFRLSIPPGYTASASGCGGALVGDEFTTAAISNTCLITATFTPITYPIATSATHGTVTCTPNPVPHGQEAHCTATPDTGYQFTSWSGSCSGTGACALANVTGLRSVTATFAANNYPIATNATHGTVTCTPNPVPHGQEAHCTATPDTGYHFTSWSGSCSGNGACALANVTGLRSVTATFAANNYPIATNATHGTVTCTPNPVPHGQDAHCTATPDTGYQFTSWSGSCSGTGACALANVTELRSVGAQFTLTPVDGTCGAAASVPAATAPSANLCATGTASGVQSTNGQYAWECAGAHGGVAQQCSAPWAHAGQGAGTVQVNGAGGWHVSTASFAATLPATLPPGAQTVHAPLALVLNGGSGTAQVTLTLTEPAPAGAVYLKYGPSPEGLGCSGTAACAQPHWYALPGAQFAPDGLSVTFTLTDGGAGDSDAVPGQITDPGLPVLLAAAPAGGAHAIPTLSAWALALLVAAVACVAGCNSLPKR
ncbi:IPTL-CTERM sorting domain-containing protein [Delftia acidovorans]|uniref:IPTL-CTERM sorting domain-containing protein n=1 Tax=Delftia acidovorans TaxID=80866 RepID=UPI001EDE6709|nr:IPTL-CTERM sorting domain-containing protein [Delftia acidovorans]MCG3783884.1 IPTL-CTERM sorting domain-containing protein [Delftia acidovorans]